MEEEERRKKGEKEGKEEEEEEEGNIAFSYLFLKRGGCEERKGGCA